MKHTLLKGLVVSLALNGLCFAVDSNTDTSMPRQNTGTSGDLNTPAEAPSVSPSGSGTTQQGVNTNSTTGTTKASGTVESIDRAGNRIRVRDAQGKVTEYQLTNETNFMSNGKKGKFSDLNAGDFVIVESNPDVGVLRVDFGTVAQ